MRCFWLICVALYHINALGQVDLSSKANLIIPFPKGKLALSKEGKGSITGKKIDSSMEYTISTDTFVDYIYNLSVKVPFQAKNVKKGEKLLIAFEAITDMSSLETGEARINWMWKYGKATNDKANFTSSVGNKWRTYYVPFEIPKFAKKEDLVLNLQFGYPPQKLRIKNLAIYHFDQKTPISALPKTIITYEGMEADALWRKEAAARIDSIRKGDIFVHVVQNGKPVDGIEVELKMKNHYFKWGAAVRAEEILQNPNLLDNVAKTFNQVVLENDLKMKHYDQSIPAERVSEAIEKIRQRGLTVKGHALVWPGYRYLPEKFLALKNKPKEVEKLINQHVDNILKATNGVVTHWDVVNEAYTNQDLQTITGSEDLLYQQFRTLKKNYPSVEAYINEYGIISQGGFNTKKQEWYYNFAKRIIASTDDGLDGIGIQSHIGADLTPPTRILEILDYYAPLGKKIGISEFTMDVQDSIIRKMYTEDFLFAAFSHPSVTEFLFWGFVEDKKGRVDILREDGNLGAMGKAFYGLVHQLWKTNFIAKTDADGMIKTRGFYGSYQYKYTWKGKEVVGEFLLTPKSSGAIAISIPSN